MPPQSRRGMPGTPNNPLVMAGLDLAMTKVGEKVGVMGGTRKIRWRSPLTSLGLIFAAITAVLDQATKFWLVHLSGIAGEAGGRLAFGPFVDFVYMRNTGISYSLFELGGRAGQLLLAAIAVLVSAGIIVWLARVTDRLTAMALGLILGGALGNAIDRPLMGGVVDFVSLHGFGFHWYVFNLADVAIVAGVIGLLYESLLGSRKRAATGA